MAQPHPRGLWFEQTLPGDASTQVLVFLAFWFLRRRYFSIFLCKKKLTLPKVVPIPDNLNHDLCKLKFILSKSDLTKHTDFLAYFFLEEDF